MALPSDQRVMDLRRLAQQLEASPPSHERDELLHRTRCAWSKSRSRYRTSIRHPRCRRLPTSQSDAGSSEHTRRRVSANLSGKETGVD